MGKKWLCGILVVVLLLPVILQLPMPTFASEVLTSSDEMLDILKKMEGFAKYPYWDTSQYSVGYGTRCPDDKLQEYKTNGITEEEAVRILHEELDYFVDAVNNFAKKYNLTFNQHQFDALVSFSYNCGASWMKDLTGYFNTAIRNGDVGSKLLYGMCLYSKAHTDYVLIHRRLAEAYMYIDGVYKAYNKDVDYRPDNYRYLYLDGNGATVRYVIHGYDAFDPMPVIADFTEIPTGVDAEGNPFVYTFAGWFTEEVGGTKVELLDGSLENGAVLYAQWADPTGQIVQLPQGAVMEPLEITVTGKTRIHSGPGSWYERLDTLEKDAKVTVTETYDGGKALWGKIDGGWISLSYTNYEEVLEDQNKQEITWPQAGTVSGNNVNVRSGAGTSHKVQYQLSAGDRVVISESVESDSLLWGKLQDGNWICLTYVEFDYVPPEQLPEPILTGVTLLSGPTRTEYVQMQDVLDMIGSVLTLHYSDGTMKAMTPTRKMVTDYSNAQLGPTTVTVEYEGFAVSFEVTIIKATVVFRNEDGTVLSTGQYAYGETVAIPQVPTKEADEAGEYVFAGWDKPVTACSGDTVYTAVFRLVEEVPPEPEFVPGDLDGNDIVDENDADYLLGYLLFPEWYPIEHPVDLDGNGTIDENDADYLLGYLLFPEWYPLNTNP